MEDPSDNCHKYDARSQPKQHKQAWDGLGGAEEIERKPVANTTTTEGTNLVNPWLDSAEDCDDLTKYCNSQKKSSSSLLSSAVLEG